MDKKQRKNMDFWKGWLKENKENRKEEEKDFKDRPFGGTKGKNL